MSERCDLCETDSVRTNANRACCRLRALAKAPRHYQVQVSQRMTADERAEIKPRLIAEIERLKGLRK